MRRLQLQVRRIGPHFRTVLIRGEEGLEKEQVARCLHDLSQGASGPFVRCHAGTLDEVPGEAWRRDESSAPLDSLMSAARGGTLFLDGVDEMSPESQAALLRALRWQELAASDRRVPHRFELRIVAAANRDLRIQVSAGRFRQELFHRIATVELALPPLRERLEDMPELMQTMLDRMAQHHGCERPRVSAAALERLLAYRWGGNLLELENVLRSAMLQSENGVIEMEHLPVLTELSSQTGSNRDADAGMKLQDVVERHVLRVLKECRGNKLRAAEQLGISRSTLYRMLDAGAIA